MICDNASVVSLKSGLNHLVKGSSVAGGEVAERHKPVTRESCRVKEKTVESARTRAESQQRLEVESQANAALDSVTCWGRRGGGGGDCSHGQRW